MRILDVFPISFLCRLYSVDSPLFRLIELRIFHCSFIKSPLSSTQFTLILLLWEHVTLASLAQHHSPALSAWLGLGFSL